MTQQPKLKIWGVYSAAAMLRWIGSVFSDALNEAKSWLDEDADRGNPRPRPNAITIYILECEDRKFYVGKSNAPGTRTAQHFEGAGSEWTRLHKPIRVLRTLRHCDAFDEDKYTKQMMARHGIDNVRGGAYCQIELDVATRALLEREIAGAQDRCYSCDSAEHFIRDCPGAGSYESPHREAGSSADESTDEEQTCARCGYSSHETADCYAKTDVYGFPIVRGRSHCLRCGRAGHKAASCFAVKDLDGEYID